MVAVINLSHLDSPWWWSHESQPKAAVRVWERVRIKKATMPGAPGYWNCKSHAKGSTALPQHCSLYTSCILTTHGGRAPLKEWDHQKLVELPQTVTRKMPANPFVS